MVCLRDAQWRNTDSSTMSVVSYFVAMINGITYSFRLFEHIRHLTTRLFRLFLVIEWASRFYNGLSSEGKAKFRMALEDWAVANADAAPIRHGIFLDVLVRSTESQNNHVLKPSTGTDRVRESLDGNVQVAAEMPIPIVQDVAGIVARDTIPVLDMIALKDNILNVLPEKLPRDTFEMILAEMDASDKKKRSFAHDDNESSVGQDNAPKSLRRSRFASSHDDATGDGGNQDAVAEVSTGSNKKDLDKTDNASK